MIWAVMNVMKRGLLAMIAVSAIACNGGSGGGDAATAGSGGGAQASAKKLRIGVSIPAADHGWTAGVKWWADQAAKLYPDVEWSIQTSKTAEDQIGAIDALMSKGLDGIVVLAFNSESLTPKAKEIHEKGVFLVNVDRGFNAPVADIFIEGDNVAFGRKSAEFMVKKLGGKGDIVVLEGIPCTVNTDRVNGANEVFKANPGIHVLDSKSGEWNKEKAFNVMQSLLAKHQHIDAIWAQDDDMALGAEKALQEAHRDKGVWMLGGAGMKDVVKRVMDGDAMFPADITYPPSMIAAGMQLCVSSLRTGKVDEVKKFMPKHMKLDVELVDKDNAKNFYFPDSVY